MRGQTVSFETHVTIDECEIDVEVEAHVTPGFAGTMYRSNGDPGDPPESGEVEVMSVCGPDGEIEFESLSASDQERLERLAEERAENYEAAWWD